MRRGKYYLLAVMAVVVWLIWYLCSQAMHYKVLHRSSYRIATSSQSVSTNFNRLQKGCTQQTNGFGEFMVTGSMELRGIRAGKLSPCKIHLAANAKLTIINSTLTSAGLVIDSAEKGNLAITSSSLLGAQASGLYIKLGTASHAKISHSTIDYPLSVSVLVGSGDSDINSSLVVTNNTIKSVATKSQGIILDSTGGAEYTNNLFQTPPKTSPALLVANSCQAINNQGAIVHCQP